MRSLLFIQCHTEVDTELPNCEIKNIPLGFSFWSNPTIHIILIVCRVAVKTQPVMTAEVRLLSAPQPAGQHTAITTLRFSMWFLPISPGEMVPLKFHYSFHHSSLLHLCLCSQQGPVMQQLKTVGVSDEMWLVALRPTRLIGVGGDSQNALRLNHRVTGITIAVMIVYSPLGPLTIFIQCLDNHSSSAEGEMWKPQQISVRIRI